MPRRHRIVNLVIALGVALALSAGAAAAQAERPLRVYQASENQWPPFSPHDGRPGMQWEMMTAIAAEAGLTLEAVVTSTARARDMLKRGLLDAEAASAHWFGHDEPDTAIYSRPFMISEDVLIAAPGADFSFYDGPRSLRAVTVHAIIGYSYPHEADWGRRIDVASEEVLVARMNRETLGGVGVCNRVTCGYWAARADQPVAFGPVYDAAPLGFRLHPSRMPLLPRLDAAIEKLAANGALARIAAAYAPGSGAGLTQ